MTLRFVKLGAIPILAFGTAGCIDLSKCENDSFARMEGPHGKDAVVHSHDCGATTPLNFQISIVDSGAAPGDSGNVFAAHAPDGFGREEAKHVARWAGDQLVITYPAGETIYVRKSKVMGVRIRYVEASAT
jgi:hypothetical protein